MNIFETARNRWEKREISRSDDWEAEIRCQFIILARKDEPTPDYCGPFLAA